MFDINSLSVSFWICVLCCHCEGLRPWTHESDDNPETRTSDLHHFHMPHTCLASLCIRDVECSLVSNLTSMSGETNLWATMSV